ncbi:MAG: septum formation initiator family protein [Clostridia bacterium]|nr:septum formation initiator family protein [Clostridia bacterium]
MKQENARTRVRSQRTKQRDGKTQKKKWKPQQVVTAVVVMIFALYFVYIMIWQQVTISKKNKEINALEEKVQTATQQTEKLEAELENLNDPAYLEQIAREKLGLVRPNERVFVDANKSQANTSD